MSNSNWFSQLKSGEQHKKEQERAGRDAMLALLAAAKTALDVAPREDYMASYDTSRWCVCWRCRTRAMIGAVEKRLNLPHSR